MTQEIEQIFKTESSRVLASLMRILGDLDLAEEALQEAVLLALSKWPDEGVPENAYSWLVSAGKFRAIDVIRRAKRGKELLSDGLGLVVPEITPEITLEKIEEQYLEKSSVDDDVLRLIFYCCHPQVSLESRIALSLRELCGLSVKEIARAFLTSDENIKKRITRAKRVFRKEDVLFEMPRGDRLHQRLDAVRNVIYLIFNEGYSPGESELKQKELTLEAIHLCRQLVGLLPDSESCGLLALLLIQESRKKARLSPQGDIIPLEDQDRALWNQELINEGLELLHQAMMSGRMGSYGLQAAIASVHAVSDSVENTQWDLIIGYYDMLLSINPSPVIELNRAAAVGMMEGPQAALDIIQSLEQDPKLSRFYILYSLKAEFLKRLGLKEEAIIAYERSIEFVSSEPERKYLRQQVKNISK
ncbi:RNA polymerase sigma factor [Kiloniella sp.]|uniref:RNA polymerase sigma factor n=1 Tax=Kiloniella sp. TaxID=1938587 RepID=UPI003B02D119